MWTGSSTRSPWNSIKPKKLHLLYQKGKEGLFIAEEARSEITTRGVEFNEPGGNLTKFSYAISWMSSDPLREFVRKGDDYVQTTEETRGEAGKGVHKEKTFATWGRQG